VKIGFKFQPLGKISNISAADPTSSFRSIPTLLIYITYAECAAAKRSEKAKQELKLRFSVNSACKDGLVLSRLERSLETKINDKVHVIELSVTDVTLVITISLFSYISPVCFCSLRPISLSYRSMQLVKLVSLCHFATTASGKEVSLVSHRNNLLSLREVPPLDSFKRVMKIGLRPMTYAPETGAINRLHFLAPIFGASFRRRFFVLFASGMKISGAVNKHV